MSAIATCSARWLRETDRTSFSTSINQSEKPGYGYQLKQGATSLTEAWDAGRNSSQNHFMLGQIMEWFYHDLAGIGCDPAGPGFNKIQIKTRPGRRCDLGQLQLPLYLRPDPLRLENAMPRSSLSNSTYQPTPPPPSGSPPPPRIRSPKGAFPSTAARRSVSCVRKRTAPSSKSARVPISSNPAFDMLTTLRIKNLALVSDLTLELQAGYNVITGETGAGKSVLIGALSLVLGERADRTLIRSGSDSCSVEAVFDTDRLQAPLKAFLDPKRSRTVRGPSTGPQTRLHQRRRQPPIHQRLPPPPWQPWLAWGNGWSISMVPMNISPCSIQPDNWPSSMPSAISTPSARPLPPCFSAEPRLEAGQSLVDC